MFCNASQGNKKHQNYFFFLGPDKTVDSAAGVRATCMQEGPVSSLLSVCASDDTTFFIFRLSSGPYQLRTEQNRTDDRRPTDQPTPSKPNNSWQTNRTEWIPSALLLLASSYHVLVWYRKLSLTHTLLKHHNPQMVSVTTGGIQQVKEGYFFVRLVHFRQNSTWFGPMHAC